MEKNETYCDSMDLANYISYKFEKKFSREISPIKLQKSLYFLFAYWGGFVSKGRSEFIKKNLEQDTSDLPLYLFDDEFQAWPYGPVIPKIYKSFKIGKYFRNTSTVKDIKKIIENIESNSYISMFINDLLEDIFNISDFKLVDISHSDKTWIANYKPSDSYHERVMNNDDIIAEYAAR